MAGLVILKGLSDGVKYNVNQSALVQNFVPKRSYLSPFTVANLKLKYILIFLVLLYPSPQGITFVIDETLTEIGAKLVFPWIHQELKKC